MPMSPAAARYLFLIPYAHCNVIIAARVTIPL